MNDEPLDCCFDPNAEMTFPSVIKLLLMLDVSSVLEDFVSFRRSLFMIRYIYIYTSEYMYVPSREVNKGDLAKFHDRMTILFIQRFLVQNDGQNTVTSARIFVHFMTSHSIEVVSRDMTIHNGSYAQNEHIYIYIYLEWYHISTNHQIDSIIYIYIYK